MCVCDLRFYYIKLVYEEVSPRTAGSDRIVLAHYAGHVSGLRLVWGQDRFVEEGPWWGQDSLMT